MDVELTGLDIFGYQPSKRFRALVILGYVSELHGQKMRPATDNNLAPEPRKNQHGISGKVAQRCLGLCKMKLSDTNDTTFRHSTRSNL